MSDLFDLAENRIRFYFTHMANNSKESLKNLKKGNKDYEFELERYNGIHRSIAWSGYIIGIYEIDELKWIAESIIFQTNHNDRKLDQIVAAWKKTSDFVRFPDEFKIEYPEEEEEETEDTDEIDDTDDTDEIDDDEIKEEEEEINDDDEMDSSGKHVDINGLTDAIQTLGPNNQKIKLMEITSTKE